MKRNVTLGTKEPGAEGLRRKPFPCPLCKKALPIKLSFKQKPYCVCQDCGVQLFVRNQAGVSKLQVLLLNETPMEETFSGSSVAVALYNRLESLRKEREALEQKQGFVFRDKSLDDAIATISKEIEHLKKEIRDQRNSS